MVSRRGQRGSLDRSRQEVESGGRRGLLDTFAFRPLRARFTRLRITQGTRQKVEPMVQELTLTG